MGDNMKAKTEEQIAIDIDYETFTTDEIIKIFDFNDKCFLVFTLLASAIFFDSNS